MADYKLNTDKIKELLNTPPALGVEVAHSISDIARQFVEKQETYIYECLVDCKVDPDALKKTANKNKELMDTLADIYRRIEIGKLIELPCKIGDVVYIIDDSEEDYGEPYVLGVRVLQFFINENGIALDLQMPLGLRLNTWAAIGKNVFLTKEEAEAKMKGGEE